MKTLWERETACSMSKCNRSNRLTCPACLVPQRASISAGDRQQPLKPPRLLPKSQPANCPERERIGLFQMLLLMTAQIREVILIPTLVTT